MKPVFVEPGYLTPLKDGEVKPCMRCTKETARWVIGKNGNTSTECSYCILTKSQWGSENRPGILRLIAAVEGQIGKKISDLTGFVLEEEADRILAAIRHISTAKLTFRRLRAR